MIGCFNISLYLNFDVHRIFDLILFRLWDFILWWFDLDFVLFDFNFDFILCLSFLFLFLLNFFIKLLFSFLNNYIIFVNKYNTGNIITLFFMFLTFITFSFIAGIFYINNALECYFNICTVCFIDFVGFFETSVCLTLLQTNFMTVLHVFMLFYFIIHIIVNTIFLLIRFFFSYSYYSSLNTDIMLNLNYIDIKASNLVNALIINNKMYNTNYLIALYQFFNAIKLNLFVLNSLIAIFYNYRTHLFFNSLNIFNIIFKKVNRYLYNMYICYSLLFYRTQFSHLIFLFILNYIVFTINLFGIFIKDFIYINIIINMYNILVAFTFNNLNINYNKYLLFKKQLMYNEYC